VTVLRAHDVPWIERIEGDARSARRPRAIRANAQEVHREHITGQTVLDVERASQRIAASRATFAARISAAGIDGFGMHRIARPEMRERMRRRRYDSEEFRRVYGLSRG